MGRMQCSLRKYVQLSQIDIEDLSVARFCWRLRVNKNLTIDVGNPDNSVQCIFIFWLFFYDVFYFMAFFYLVFISCWLWTMTSVSGPCLCCVYMHIPYLPFFFFSHFQPKLKRLSRVNRQLSYANGLCLIDELLSFFLFRFLVIRITNSPFLFRTRAAT